MLINYKVAIPLNRVGISIFKAIPILNFLCTLVAIPLNRVGISISAVKFYAPYSKSRNPLKSGRYFNPDMDYYYDLTEELSRNPLKSGRYFNKNH